jgi:hypothetical protein
VGYVTTGRATCESKSLLLLLLLHSTAAAAAAAAAFHCCCCCCCCCCMPSLLLQVACGDTHTLVCTEAGELFTFGRNQNGQLGLGDTCDVLAPRRVTDLQVRGAWCWWWWWCQLLGVAAGVRLSCRWGVSHLRALLVGLWDKV